MTSHNHEISDQIREEAAAWLLEVNGSHCREEEFEQWLMSSPQHMDAWSDVQHMWGLLPATEPYYERLTVPRAVSDVSEIRAHPARGRVNRRKSGLRLIAGSAFLTILGLAAFLIVPDVMVTWQADYSTKVAESRQLTLEDGSIVQLGADSAMKVDFSADARHVSLLRGEAYFSVTHDTARPFFVEAESVEVRVVGTEFDVKLDDFSTEVSLARGAVTATLNDNDVPFTQNLMPGERLTVDRQTGKTSMERVSPDDIGTWRNGRLFVVNASVEEVVESIQRYHTAWIMLADGDLSRTRVTGIYDLSNPDQALAALVSPFGGKVRQLASFGRVISRY